MRLANATAYRTLDLRAVLCAVHTIGAAGLTGSPNARPQSGRLRTWPDLVVAVRYARKGNRKYTGHAYLSGYHATLSVPRGSCNLRVLVALWQHELWHLYGLRHDAMADSVGWCRANTLFVERVVTKLGDQFGGALHETVRVPAPKPTAADKRVEKVARLVARRDAWLAKQRRAANALAKIERSLRRYEKLGAEVAPAKAARPKRRRRRNK